MVSNQNRQFRQESPTLAVNRPLEIFMIALVALLVCLPAGAYQKKGSDLSEAAVRAKWKAFEKNERLIRPKGRYPYMACFKQTAGKYGLPLPLLLAVARGESNFNPHARSDADCHGIMQIQWPGTARHLGIERKSRLYDPCTNIEAGGRYLAELLARYNGSTYLALAAYNYGPGRIDREVRGGGIPQGARWYAAYIYGHLRYVETAVYEDSGRLLVLEPDRSFAQALRMKEHFEEMTRGLVFEVFKSQHYTYDLYLIFKPGHGSETAARLESQTGFEAVGLRKA